MATADSMLFSWKDVERLPDLERLALALDRLPDGELVSALVAGWCSGHESAASLLRELRHNPRCWRRWRWSPPRPGAPTGCARW